MNHLESKSVEIVKCISLRKLDSEDEMYLVNLISDLLGDRKQWYSCLASEMVTAIEVASAILGHIYTEKNGYFRTKGVINFKSEKQVVELLENIT